MLHLHSQPVEVAPMPPKTTFATLDGLRGLAAVAVLTRHAPSQSWAWWLPGSYLAVDMFFMISGFVLAHAYGERLHRDLSIKRFMLARFIRLWPLYILGTVAGLALKIVATAGSNPLDPGHVAASAFFGFFMMPTPPMLSVSTGPFPFNGPAWSLFWELVIGLVFAVLGPRMRPASLGLVLAIGIGFLLITATHFGSIDTGSVWSNFFGGGGRVVFAFFAGVAVYRVHRFAPLAAAPPAWVGAVVLLAVFAGHIAPAWRPAYDVAMVVLVFPTIIYSGAGREPQGWLRWLALIAGRISYPLYVTQIPLMVFASLVSMRVFGVHFSALSHAGTAGLIVAGSCGALLLGRFYDEPVRAWLTRRSKLSLARVRAAEAAAP